MRRLMAALLMTAVLPAMAAEKTFTVDTNHTRIAFKAKTVLFSVEGSFGKYGAEIKGDPDTLNPAYVTLKIDVASINTGVDARDNHLKSPDFFNAQQFPQIIFTSNKAWKQDGKVMVAGTLEMHGVKKGLTLAFDPVIAKNGAGNDEWTYATELTIKRSDFGVGTADIGAKISLKDEVALDILLAGFFH